MIEYIKRIDTFNKNIILVLLGTSLANVLALLYQLLIAHSLSSVDFAGFNSLLAIFTMISSPLTTIQTAVVKYTADFNAHGQIEKVKSLLFNLFKIILPFAAITLVVSCLFSPCITDKLKISSVYSGYNLAALLALSWISPVFAGALQGLELFKWLVAVSLLTGVAKLVFTFVFIKLGLNISGALAGLLLSVLIGIIISIGPLKNFLSLRRIEAAVDLKGFFWYLAPVAVSLFCFMSLVNFDMVLVKYLFSPYEGGLYSLAQMVGKIFLFLPSAISIVMFPMTAGLSAKNMDTGAALRRSLLYGLLLCVIANVVYNLFPSFVLEVLTGKVFGESVKLGRLFGISMSFFTLLLILINYFLSVKDLRFIKFLIISAILQPLAIILLHNNLMSVQIILCANSALLLFINLFLVRRKVLTRAFI